LIQHNDLLKVKNRSQENICSSWSGYEEEVAISFTAVCDSAKPLRHPRQRENMSFPTHSLADNGRKYVTQRKI
jgi:hypothetical protein